MNSPTAPLANIPKETLDAMQDGVFMFTPGSMSFFYVNPISSQKLGYSQEEFLAMHPWDIKPMLPEAEFRQFIHPLLEGSQTSMRFETIFRRKGGDDFPVEIFLQRSAPEGRDPFFLAIATDITHRNAMQRRATMLEGMFDSIADAVLLIRAKNGSVVYANNAACLLYGKKAGFINGMNFTDFGTNFNKAQFQVICDLMKDSPQGKITLQSQALRHNVQEFDIEISLSLLELNGEEYAAAVVTDISSRERNQQALTKQAGLLKGIISATEQPLLVCNADWKVSLLNKKASELLGWSETDILGRTLPNFQAGESAAPSENGSLPSDLMAALGQESHAVLRQWWMRGNGDKFYGDIYVNALKDASGSIVAYILAVTDRTEQQAIAERERLQRMILQHAGAGIYAFTPDGLVTLFNPEASRMLGYTPQETLGQRDAACWLDAKELVERAASLSSEQGRAIQPGIEIFTAKAAGGETVTQEWTCVRKDGSRFPGLLTISRLAGDGDSIGGYLVLLRDISREKEAEDLVARSYERLEKAVAERTWELSQARDEARALLKESLLAHDQTRRLLDLDADAVIIIEEESRLIVYVNQSTESLLNKDAGSLIGTELDIPVRHEAEGGNVEIILPGGCGRVAQMRSTHVMWNKSRHMAIFLHEITQLKRHAEDLQLAKESAERANHAKSDFLAAISHELRTPLTSICGFSKTIKNDPAMPPDVRDEFIGTIHEQSMRLARLVEQLLDLSSVRSGQARFDDVEIDLLEVAGLSLKEVEFAAQAKSLQVVLDSPRPAIPFSGDPVRLQSLLTNLISNAVKFSPDRSTVEVAFTFPAGGIGIRVRDEGPGIPEDELSAIFDKFHRVQRPSNFVEGTGLGLPIAKAIVNNYGGIIEVQSQLGKGTTFQVFLPDNKPGGEPDLDS